MKPVPSLTTYQVCSGRDGNPIEFSVHGDCYSCLGYDRAKAQLVVLHVSLGSESWNDTQKQSFHERVLLTRGLGGRHFPRIVGTGRQDGLMLYATTVEEGESARSYAKRLAPLPQAQAVHLTLGLCERLFQLQEVPRIFRSASLKSLMVVRTQPPDGADLCFQLQDLGLCEVERRAGDDQAEERLARELGELLFLLLTGQEPSGGREGQEVMFLLERCPSLQGFMQDCLGQTGRVPSLAAALKGLRDAQSLMNVGQAMQIVPPRSWIEPHLFPAADINPLFPARFALKPGWVAGVGDLSRVALDQETRKEVVLHPMPLAGVAAPDSYRAVPDGLREVNRKAATHLILPESAWSSESLRFLVEQRPEGFFLSQLLAHRKALRPEEAGLILRQIQVGVAQAEKLKLALPNLTLSDTLVSFVDHPGDATLRLRLLMPVTEWPGFATRLRVHLTARSFLQTTELGPCPEGTEPTLEEAFFSVAMQLLGGLECLAQGRVPMPLAQKLSAFLAEYRRSGHVPSIPELLRAFPRPEREAAISHVGSENTPAHQPPLGLPVDMVTPKSMPLPSPDGIRVQHEPPQPPSIAATAILASEAKAQEPTETISAAPSASAAPATPTVEAVHALPPPCDTPQVSASLTLSEPEPLQSPAPATTPTKVEANNAAEFLLISPPAAEPVRNLLAEVPNLADLMPELSAIVPEQAPANVPPPTPQSGPEPLAPAAQISAAEKKVPAPRVPEEAQLTTPAEPPRALTPASIAASARLSHSEEQGEEKAAVASADASPQQESPTPPQALDPAPAAPSLLFARAARNQFEPILPTTAAPTHPEATVQGIPPFPVEEISPSQASNSAIAQELDPNADDLPTLRIDLARLTTADSIFGHRKRNVTLRNN